MTIYTDTVIVGAGQAGLAVSYYLGRQARDHVVLEQADKPAEAWRNHRWDSFTLNTPNWQSRLPGAEDPGTDPNGFASREEIVDYFETYARRFRLPIRYRALVSSVERDPRSGDVCRHNRGWRANSDVQRGDRDGSLSNAEGPCFLSRFACRR